jgi:hypothetical protein
LLLRKKKKEEEEKEHATSAERKAILQINADKDLIIEWPTEVQSTKLQQLWKRTHDSLKVAKTLRGII